MNGKPFQKEKKPTNEMDLPYLSHLKELRICLLKVFIFVLLVFILLLPFSDLVLSVSFMPIKKALPHNNPIVFTALTEGFMTHIKMSFWWALIISVPFILYQIWLFIEPALYRKEKRLFKIIIPFLLILFYTGASFAWFFFIPFLVGFSSSLVWDGVEFLPRLQNCMSFTLKTVFFMGVFFELPLIFYFLLHSEVIEREFFIKNRKKIYITLYLMILVILPSDFILQIIFFIPMVLIFEFFLYLYKIKLNSKLTS